MTAEFRRKGEQGLVLPQIRCRWSAVPEPIRQVPVGTQQLAELQTASPAASGSGPSNWTITAAYASEFDPQAVPESFLLDLAPSKEGSEAAIAILLQAGGAFAFSAESYGYGFAKPDWGLAHAEYDVTVNVRSGQISAVKRFSLRYLDEDFAKFKLEPDT
jgi:hypothetical protein